MATHWLNEGKPLADGRICLIIDPEDGTDPLRIWGQTTDDVLAKAAKTVEHGARTITRLRTQSHPPATSGTSNGGATTTAQVPTSLTPSQQIQLTADLTNPNKAPAAVVKLMQHETGINFEEQAREAIKLRISTMQQEWERQHPEFPDSKINRKLMTDTAALRVGYENITAEVMENVYNHLQAEGLLVPADEVTGQPPTVQPPETADTRTVRPRGAASYRRTATAAPPTAQQSQKYTRESINAMNSTEYRRKLETDPEFATAVAALASQPSAVAKA